MLKAISGDLPGALQAFARAGTLVGDAPPQLARLRLDRARAARAGGDHETADRLLRQARATAQRLGMRELLARIDAESR